MRGDREEQAHIVAAYLFMLFSCDVEEMDTDHLLWRDISDAMLVSI
jgi:hypothetical protein